ncbi:hypothetical protein [Aporhodopirellula aestuarii]|uniref:Uncharacterized protein n=1 Tax=Aporhodopirellula aestuarii TaxID=2950107 RepID=A0ABT0TZH4_9BACT|nr:hypothetical protein [Aporhodopirellula aestuarii]MCM2369896.1 hypothetical protein [Aporhodopirellula aestuarii]
MPSPDDCRIWCEEIRDILKDKIKRFQNKKLNKLKKCDERVVAALKRLQQKEQDESVEPTAQIYPILMRTYSQLSTEISEVVDGTRDHKVSRISDSLTILDSELKIALASSSREKKQAESQRDNQKKELVKKSLQNFSKAKKSAESLISKSQNKADAGDIDYATRMVEQSAVRVKEIVASTTYTAETPESIRDEIEKLNRIGSILAGSSSIRYEALMRDAQLAEVELRSIPEAATPLANLSRLISQARRLGASGQYSDAANQLEGYSRWLTEGRQAAKIRERALPTDALEEEAAEVRETLEDLNGLGSADEIAVFGRQIEALVKGKVDETAVASAIEELKRLDVTIDTRTQALMRVKADADKIVQTIESGRSTLLQELSIYRTRVARFDANSFKDVEEDINRFSERFNAAMELLNAPQIEDAAERLTSLQEELVDLRLRFSEEGWESEEFKAKLTNQLGQLRAIAAFPQVASEKATLQNLLFGLRAQCRNASGYTDAISEYESAGLEERFKALIEQAAELPSGEDFEELRKVSDTCWSEVRNQYSATSNLLLDLRTHLAEVPDPNDTRFHLLLETAWSKFNNQYDRLTDAEAIATLKDQSVASMQRVQDAINDVLQTPAKLEVLVGEIKESQSNIAVSKLPGMIAKLIEELGVLSESTKDFEDELNSIIEAGADAEDYESRLVALHKLIELRLAPLRRRTDAMAKRALEASEAFQDGLRYMEIPSRYQSVRNEFEMQARDIEDLARSGDPALIELANQMRMDCATRLLDVAPASNSTGERSGATFDMIDKLVKTLVNELGAGNKRVVSTYLPDTYLRLSRDLKEAIAETRRCEPGEGIQIIRKMEVPIVEAVQLAKSQKEKIELFESRVDVFQTEWKELRKLADRNILHPAKELNAYFDARIDEAKALSSTEKGLPEANKILQRLFREKMDLTGDDATSKIDAKNDVCKSNIAKVKEAAEQFVAQHRYCVEILIPEAKRLEENKGDGDLGQIEGMETIAKSAESSVKNYLKMLETNLVKKRGADKAPDLDKAREAFSQAQDMLEQIKRNAMRLASMTSSTNVNVSGNLVKVKANWEKQSRAFDTVIAAITSLMESDAKDVDAGGVDLPDSVDSVGFVEKLRSAKEVIGNLENSFDASAFNATFEILIQNPEGLEGAAKLELRRRKLAAREDALLIMRRYREEILLNPVFKKLVDASNPYEQKRVTGATGSLRAALKRVEIESLIA